MAKKSDRTTKKHLDFAEWVEMANDYLKNVVCTDHRIDESDPAVTAEYNRGESAYIFAEEYYYSLP